KQEALNELYVRCPLLMFLPKHFSRSELALFYNNKNVVTNAVAKIEKILKDSNTSYKSYLGDNPSKLDKKMLLPIYTQAYIGLKQAYPKSTHSFITSVFNFEKTKAKTDEIADVLSLVSNVCTGLGLFFGFTPMALGSSVFFGIAGLSEKSIAFIRAAYDNNIRKALRAYPNGGGFLTIAKKGGSLADEIALVILELAFLLPGVKQVATTRKALAKEAKTLRNQHEAIRRLDHSYREQLKHIRLTFAIRHQTGRKFPKTNLVANKKALAENKLQRTALMHDRGLTQSRLAVSKTVHERLLRMSLEGLEATALSLQIQRREILTSIKMAENYRNQLMQMLSDSSVPRRHIEQAIAGIEHMDAKYAKQLLNNSRSIAAVDESIRTFSPEGFAKSMQKNTQTIDSLEANLKELNSSIKQLSEAQRKLVQSITYDEQLLITTNNMEMQRIFSGILEQEQRLRHQYLKDRTDMLNAAKETVEKQKTLSKPLSEDQVIKEGAKGVGMEVIKQTAEFGISSMTKETTSPSDRPYGPQLPHQNSNTTSQKVPLKNSKSSLKKQRATARKNRGL
ncbi:MAG: hypothetical protein MK137_02790, partial [Rickettsiales bacterium]|nr:hypothetical protein [Rickettsiales bacterium]